MVYFSMIQYIIEAIYIYLEIFFKCSGWWKMIIDLLSLKVGDSSHISPENDVLCSIINDEKKKESFTVVEIGGISSSHVTYLRQHLSSWTRQLALVEFYGWH